MIESYAVYGSLRLAPWLAAVLLCGVTLAASQARARSDALPAPLPLAGEQPCVGDCGELDNRVNVNELLLGVNISLGHRLLDACPSFDADGNLAVGISELIRAVDNAMNGCPPSPGPTVTVTATPTATPLPPTPTPTETPTPELGPLIVFFGVALADDTLLDPVAVEGGVPVYRLLHGRFFRLVIEGREGLSGLAPEKNTFVLTGAPDLQVLVSEGLGDESADVCDGEAPDFGGVPGFDRPEFSDDPEVVAAMNDLGCRFHDGKGNPAGRRCSDGCVLFEHGERGCVDPDTLVQFCSRVISRAEEFQVGDTLVRARLRDERGNTGPAAQMIVRVEAPALSDE